MCDRGEIENLLYEYQARLDAGDLVAMAELFAEATIDADTVGVSWTGSDEVLALFRQIFRVYPDGSPHTTHTTLNPIVHVDDAAGTATCRSVYVVFQQVDDFPLQPIITGGCCLPGIRALRSRRALPAWRAAAMRPAPGHCAAIGGRRSGRGRSVTAR